MRTAWIIALSIYLSIGATFAFACLLPDASDEALEKYVRNNRDQHGFIALYTALLLAFSVLVIAWPHAIWKAARNER